MLSVNVIRYVSVNHQERRKWCSDTYKVAEKCVGFRHFLKKWSWNSNFHR